MLESNLNPIYLLFQMFFRRTKISFISVNIFLGI